MKIKKIIVTLFFAFVINVLSGCALIQAVVDSTGRYFISLNAPKNDPSDQCNAQVQEITRIGNSQYPIDSIVKNLEALSLEAIRIAISTGNLDVFFRRVSTSYLTQIMSKGGVRAFLTDINKDVRNQQQMDYAVTNLRKCRTNQARRIKRSPSREANQEKDVLLKRSRRESEYIKAANKNFGKRIVLYEETSGEMSGSNAGSGVRYINISSLNVRNRPTSSNSVVLGTLPRNTMISVIDDSGDWVKIDYHGQTAYVIKKYTRITSTSTTATQTAGVNKAIVSAKNTEKGIDQKREQMLVEIDEILASDGIT